MSSWVSRLSNCGKMRPRFLGFPRKELVVFRITSLCFKSCFFVGIGLIKSWGKSDTFVLILLSKFFILLKEYNTFGLNMFCLICLNLREIRFTLQGLNIDQLSNFSKNISLSVFLFHFILSITSSSSTTFVTWSSSSSSFPPRFWFDLLLPLSHRPLLWLDDDLDDCEMVWTSPLLFGMRPRVTYHSYDCLSSTWISSQSSTSSSSLTLTISLLTLISSSSLIAFLSSTSKGMSSSTSKVIASSTVLTAISSFSKEKLRLSLLDKP